MPPCAKVLRHPGVDPAHHALPEAAFRVGQFESADDGASHSEGAVELLIGDTLTPVPARYCVPFATMLDIAAYFLDNGGRYPGVEWQEVQASVGHEPRG